MDRPKVPKFGNWDGEDNDAGVNYTVYFDKARESKGEKKMMMINPNDPQENPELFNKSADHHSTDESGSRNNKSEEPAVRQVPLRSAHRANIAEGQGDYGTGRGGQRPVRSAKASAGSDNSFDRSPLHPRAKAAAGRGSNANSVSHGTAGRARQRPATTNPGDQSPDIGATVPKFGDWDENDPQKTPDFTQAFERIRDERNNNGTGTPKHDAYATRIKKIEQPKKCCCCPWW